MELCAPYQNIHHQLTVLYSIIIGSQQGKTCWLIIKLISNINVWAAAYVVKTLSNPAASSGMRQCNIYVETLVTY